MERLLDSPGWTYLHWEWGQGRVYLLEKRALVGYDGALKIRAENICTPGAECTYIKKRIRDLRNEAGKAADLAEQACLQSEIGDLERRQRKLRQEIFEVEDRILAERDRLVNAIKGKLKQSITVAPLMTLRWSLNSTRS